jgi:L-rhamnose-H+ transport protein
MPKGAPAGSSQAMNYILSAVAGFTWYLQFFFYTMGESQMGKKYVFSSWTLHMASIIIFSTLWGIALNEWRGVGARTKTLVFLTLLVLVSSTAIVGYGNYLSVH